LTVFLRTVAMSLRIARWAAWWMAQTRTPSLETLETVKTLSSMGNSVNPV